MFLFKNRLYSFILMGGVFISFFGSSLEQFLFSSSSAATAVVSPNQYLTNFDDQNLDALAQRLLDPEQMGAIHIVQLGDSHTAGDYFTGQLRSSLQQRFGNAGIGFVPAYPVKGIRFDTVTLSIPEKKPWQTISSRTGKDSSFPLGGYVLVPQEEAGSITIQPKANFSRASNAQISLLYHAPEPQQVRVNQTALQLPQSDLSHWQFSEHINAKQFPIHIDIQESSKLQIGGAFIADRSAKGVIFSNLGINGATLGYLDRWEPAWKQTLQQLEPSMIILAYGTNEAFNDKLDLIAYQTTMLLKVQELREQFPEAVFMLVGPPDSFKLANAKVENPCVVATAYQEKLEEIIRIQRTVAEQTHTLFWDWRAAMGGACAMEDWKKQGLARADYVHLTEEGYRRSALMLEQALYSLLNERKNLSSTGS